MKTLEDAIALAALAHKGQVDKAGEAYICHPLRLMLTMTSEAERMVAVLHDAVEDTHVTLDALETGDYLSFRYGFLKNRRQKAPKCEKQKRCHPELAKDLCVIRAILQRFFASSG